jgi:membrane protease YdiL (CAAX protease family)
LNEKAFPAIILTYFALSLVIFCGGYFFPEKDIGYLNNIPALLSLVLLILIYAWHRYYGRRTELSKEVEKKDKLGVAFWILALFFLALVVRIPSVLLFGKPYEKTPLIFLTIATILAIEKTGLPIFGFKTKNLGKSLLYGLIFFLVLYGLANLLAYLLSYVFTNQIPILYYDVMPFLLTMPFMTLCVGISEEGLFRGYMQNHLEKVYTPKKAILVQAVLFGFWHFVWNLSPFDPFAMAQYVFFTFVIGLLFGYFYCKTRNLTPLVFAHGLFDAVPQGIVPNLAADEIFRTIPALNQILTLLLPYVISTVLILLFIKFLAKEI